MQDSKGEVSLLVIIIASVSLKRARSYEHSNISAEIPALFPYITHAGLSGDG